jgi:phosphoenolpyruvate carboxykinase (GTP)
MAMLPFCGYNMAEYFKHWLETGKRMKRAPKIFHVNWFRTDEKGEFLWPGFGENLRVLEWILNRCNNKVGSVETPIGHVPLPPSIDMTGLEAPKEAVRGLLCVDKKAWLQELKDIKKFFRQFKIDLPQELWQEYEALQKRLKASR